LKFKVHGWTLSEFEKISMFQFKRYLEAIGRKESEDYKMNASIFRAAFMNQESFKNFLDGFDNDNCKEKSLTEQEMKDDFGFGKKG